MERSSGHHLNQMVKLRVINSRESWHLVPPEMQYERHNITTTSFCQKCLPEPNQTSRQTSGIQETEKRGTSQSPEEVTIQIKTGGHFTRQCFFKLTTLVLAQNKPTQQPQGPRIS